MSGCIVVEVVSTPRPVVEVIAEKTIIVEILIPGPQGIQGPPGVGALDLPLAITSPQDGDILTFDPALQTAGAWKNVRRNAILNGGSY